MRIWVLAIIAAFISNGSAVAQPPRAPPTNQSIGAATPVDRKGDGHELWQICGETTSGHPPVACMTYVEGVLDGRDFGVTSGYPPYLIPDDVTVGQITDVVRNYLSKHPEHRNWIAPSLIEQALSTAWPAPK
jgi:hypothetical protein